LPDVSAGLAPRPLVLVNLRDQLGRLASEEDLNKDLAIVRAAYIHTGGDKKLLELRSADGKSGIEQLEAWLP
jgi:hypothetical protein